MNTVMDPEAIISEFSAAKKKSVAVSDLAEKNGCSYEEMRSFLSDHGADISRVPKNPRNSGTATKDASNTSMSVKEIEERYQATIRKNLDEIRELRDQVATLSADADKYKKYCAEMANKENPSHPQAEPSADEVTKLRTAIVNYFLSVYGELVD